MPENNLSFTMQPNTACTGRLGLGAFFELVLRYDSFPFSSILLASRR
jgi:hypothetical protein